MTNPIKSPDELAVGKGRVDQTQGVVFSAHETTDLGHVTGTAVSPGYTAHASRFTGKIHWLQIDLGEDTVGSQLLPSLPKPVVPTVAADAVDLEHPVHKNPTRPPRRCTTRGRVERSTTINTIDYFVNVIYNQCNIDNPVLSAFARFRPEELQ
jgi:hypothetical protein